MTVASSGYRWSRQARSRWCRVRLSGWRGEVRAAGAASTHAITDVSAQRRHHYRHHGGGNAAAAAAFAGIIGTVGAIAASQANRDAYYDYGPGYYGPPPVYYGAPRYPSPYGGAGSYGYGGGSYLDPGGNIIPY